MKWLQFRLLGLKTPVGVKWRVMSIGLCVFAVVIIVYDVYAVLRPSPQNQPLYLMPFAVLAFAILCEVVRRQDLIHPPNPGEPPELPPDYEAYIDRKVKRYENGNIIG